MGFPSLGQLALADFFAFCPNTSLAAIDVGIAVRFTLLANLFFDALRAALVVRESVTTPQNSVRTMGYDHIEGQQHNLGRVQQLPGFVMGPGLFCFRAVRMSTSAKIWPK